MNTAASLLILAALLSGCGFVPDPTPGPPPTEAEAIAFMRELVAVAQTGDLAGMCEHAGGGNCTHLIESAGGPRAIPQDPPVVAGTRLIESSSSGDAVQGGGILLVLCGTDGLHRPYRTEMLVSRSRGQIHVINAVYWSGFRLAVSNRDGDPSGGAGIECP